MTTARSATGRSIRGSSRTDEGTCRKVNALGLEFGLWIEPEMINEDSDLYRTASGLGACDARKEPLLRALSVVLDFSRPEVVDGIYDMLCKIFWMRISLYIKWDMNRSVTECYSVAYPPEQQGEIYHRYILGVYRLYEKLNRRISEDPL